MPRGVLRETDPGARLGGDKFATLVTGEASLAEAPALAEKLEIPLSVRSISVAFAQNHAAHRHCPISDHGRDATAHHHATMRFSHQDGRCR